MEYVVQIWQTYPVLLDLALYFFVFTAAARAGLAKTFPGHEGKALALAIGLALATSLATAQNTLGFSLENLGPIAAIILCGIVSIASYRFMHHAQIPTSLTATLALLLGIITLRATMPELTKSIAQNNKLAVLAIAGLLLLWAWTRSDKHAHNILQRRPGMILAHHHDLPETGKLHKARHLIKDGMRKATKRNNTDERKAGDELDSALQTLEKEGLTQQNTPRLNALMNKALSRAVNIQNRAKRVFKLDQALERFDTQWLARAHKVHYSQLPQNQQHVVRQAVQEERKRIQAENNLQALENQINTSSDSLEQAIEQAKACAQEQNPAGASGWILEAQKALQQLENLEARALKWEKRMLALVKREERDLAAPDTKRASTAPNA